MRDFVFKAHRIFYHSTLGLRVIKKKKGNEGLPLKGCGIAFEGGCGITFQGGMRDYL